MTPSRDVVILVNLASYASITGRTEEAKTRLRRAPLISIRMLDE
jgi:hypothetical protein